MSCKIGGSDAAVAICAIVPLSVSARSPRLIPGGRNASVGIRERSLRLSHQQSLETKACLVQEAAGQGQDRILIPGRGGGEW